MSQLDRKVLLAQPFTLGSITIDPQSISISYQHTQLNCEPKVFQILIYFCQHPDQIISREQLLEDLWQGRIVSDNAINRKIYQLRKLIAELDSSKEYIETIPKYGYKLLQPIEIIKENPHKLDLTEQQTTEHEITIKQDTKLGQLLQQWWLSPLLLTITFVIISQFNFHSPPKPLEIQQLTAKQGVELDASLSPDGQYLVYSQSNNEKGNKLGHQLMYKNLNNGNIQSLTNNQALTHDISAQWHPKGGKLAFIRLSYKNDNKVDKNDSQIDKSDRESQGNNCGIHQIILEPNQTFTESKKVANCDSADIPVISWGNSTNQLFIAQRQKKTLPYNIYSLNLHSGAIEQVTRSVQGSNMSGHYFINRNNDGSKQIVLEYLSSDKVKVKVFTSEKFALAQQFELDAHIKTIAWHPKDNQLYFRRGNYLDKVNLDGSDRQTVFHIGSSFGDLNFSNDGDKLIFANKTVNTDIVEYPLNASIQPVAKPLIASSKKDLRPRYANNTDTIAFISDRSGSKQFWLQSHEQQARLIKGFSFDIGTPDFSWSPDDKSILYEYHGQIYILNVTFGNTRVILDSSHKAYNSRWSHDGSKIIYSSTKSGDWQLWALDLANNNHQQVTLDGGYSGFLAQDGQLYFSKYHHDGLYRLDSNGIETQLIADFSLLNWLNWRLKGEKIYFAKVWGTQADSGIYSYDINTQVQQRLFAQQQGLLHDYSISADGTKLSITRHMSQTGDILMLTGLNQTD